MIYQISLAVFKLLTTPTKISTYLPPF